MAAPTSPEKCVIYPVKGNEYLVYGWIKDATTGNPISTIGNLSATISKDGDTAAGSTNTPVAVSGMNGRFYLVLEAAEMGAYNTAVVVSSDTADSLDATLDITTLDLSEKAGHWRGQDELRFEDAISTIASYIQNQVSQDTNSGLITVKKYGGASDYWTQAVDSVGTEEVKGEAS